MHTRYMIYLGADHAGFELKEKTKALLARKNISMEDLGAHEQVMDDDYPDFGFPVAEAVGQGKGEGILFCESAGGMTILANKVKGVRAVECASPIEAKHAKEHNNANVLVISKLAVNGESLPALIDTWLATPFSNEERHARRLAKITAYENDHVSFWEKRRIFSLYTHHNLRRFFITLGFHSEWQNIYNDWNKEYTRAYGWDWL